MYIINEMQFMVEGVIAGILLDDGLAEVLPPFSDCPNR
jgi:hypothetical protein